MSGTKLLLDFLSDSSCRFAASCLAANSAADGRACHQNDH